MNEEKSITEPTDKMVAAQLARLAEAKEAIANGEKIVVAVPMGELIEACGVPFTVGRIKKNCLILIPVRGYELMKETPKQKLARIMQEEEEGK